MKKKTLPTLPDPPARTPETDAEITLALTDAKNTIMTLITDRAKRDFMIKDQVAQLEGLDARIEELETELVTLRADNQTFRDQGLADLVTAAIDNYGAKKGITERDRPTLMLLLRNAPDSFLGLYPALPAVPAEQKYLLRNFTDHRGGAPQTSVIDNSEPPMGPTVDRRTMALQIARERGVSFGAAQLVVAKLYPQGH